MNYRKLGTSDLEVSEISLGSWLTYSGGVERAQAEACVKAAFEAGINFFDTANVYGGGRRRRCWGRCSPGTSAPPTCSRRRCTSRCPTPTAGSPRRRSTSRSTPRLSALRTDHVDLYQCHRYDEQTPLEETMGALTEVVRGRQGALHRLQRVARAADRRVAGAAGRRALGLQPAAVLDALARARGGGDPAVRARGDLADRVVAARAGRAHRQVPARVAAARGLARGERRR